MSTLFTSDKFFASQQHRLSQYEDQNRNEIKDMQQYLRAKLNSLYTEEVKLIRFGEFTAEMEEALLIEMRAQEKAAFETLQAKWSGRRLELLVLDDPTSSFTERYARERILDDEKETRKKLERNRSATAAHVELVYIEKNETLWRGKILEDEKQSSRHIWGLVIAPQLLIYLQDQRATHSEPNYRKFLVVCEHQSRIRIATIFCQIHLLWHEEWSRLKLRLSQKMFADYFKEWERISRKEVVERLELREFYKPMALDIQEELEHRQKRLDRRNNKILVLKKMRDLEVQRMLQREEDRKDYVAFWKKDEILKIQDIQDSIIQAVALHHPLDASSFSPGRPQQHEASSRWEKVAGKFARDLEHLAQHQDELPFQDIVAYRKSLLGFDDFISVVERSVLEDEKCKPPDSIFNAFEGHNTSSFLRYPDDHPGMLDDDEGEQGPRRDEISNLGLLPQYAASTSSFVRPLRPLTDEELERETKKRVRQQTTKKNPPPMYLTKAVTQYDQVSTGKDLVLMQLSQQVQQPPMGGEQGHTSPLPSRPGSLSASAIQHQPSFTTDSLLAASQRSLSTSSFSSPLYSPHYDQRMALHERAPPLMESKILQQKEVASPLEQGGGKSKREDEDEMALAKHREALNAKLRATHDSVARHVSPSPEARPDSMKPTNDSGEKIFDVTGKESRASSTSSTTSQRSNAKDLTDWMTQEAARRSVIKNDLSSPNRINVANSTSGSLSHKLAQQENNTASQLRVRNVIAENEELQRVSDHLDAYYHQLKQHLDRK